MGYVRGCEGLPGHLARVDAEVDRLLAYVYVHRPTAECGRIPLSRLPHLVRGDQAQLRKPPADSGRGNVTSPPVAIAESERYVTRTDLAAMLCVSLKTVDRCVSQGMPSETWGLRSRRFRVSLVLEWLRQREPCGDPQERST